MMPAASIETDWRAVNYDFCKTIAPQEFRAASETRFTATENDGIVEQRRKHHGQRARRQQQSKGIDRRDGRPQGSALRVARQRRETRLAERPARSRQPGALFLSPGYDARMHH